MHLTRPNKHPKYYMGQRVVYRGKPNVVVGVWWLSWLHDFVYRLGFITDDWIPEADIRRRNELPINSNSRHGN